MTKIIDVGRPAQPAEQRQSAEEAAGDLFGNSTSAVKVAALTAGAGIVGVVTTVGIAAWHTIGALPAVAVGVIGSITSTAIAVAAGQVRRGRHR
jgi:hypothetical protein